MNETPIAQRSSQLSRLASSENIRTLRRSSSQIVGHQSRTVSRQLSLDLKHGFAQPTAPGPLLKKQRLDAATAVPDGSGRKENQRQEEAQEPGISPRSHSLYDCLPSGALETTITPSPFPQRPSNNIRTNTCPTSQKDNAVRSEMAQARPYSLEPSRSTPLYSKKGMLAA